MWYGPCLQQLVGLLKTARSRGTVSFQADVLLRGVSDNVQITLQKARVPDGDVDTCAPLPLLPTIPPLPHPIVRARALSLL